MTLYSYSSDKMKIRLEEKDAAPAAVTRKSPYMGGGPNDKHRFTILEDGLLRYEWAPDGVFEDRPSAFAAQRDKCEHPEYRLQDSADKVEVFTKRFHLTYNKKELTPHGLYVRVFGHEGTTWRYGEEHETLGGTYRTLDGVNGRVALGPGVAAKKGFSHIDDSHTMLFTEDGFIAPRRSGTGRVDAYLFCYGHEYPEAVKAFYKVSGSQPLLPRWSLGNWWSRWYNYSAESYLELMDKFSEYKVPLTVGVMDMDWHLVDDPRVKEDGYSGWTGYTWNKDLFPDPRAFIKALHDRKLKVILNEHPADGIRSYEDMYQKMAEALDFDTSHKDPIPFQISDKKFLKAYFDVLLTSLEDDGLDFWWTDWQQGNYSQMPDVDPLWVLNHFHFLHNKKLQEQRSDEEGGGSPPMIFSRYAGPGSHRYPVGFSGDTVVTWESLNFQPEFTATASNIGYGWWSHDIGGHMLGARDDELTTRWVQLGVFSPIMRLHSTKNRWVCKEPWNLHAGSGRGPRDVVTNFLQLRHRLIPYLFTMNHLAAEKGRPLIQPMYWQYPEEDKAYEVPNQYFFGTEMMVAPITSRQNEQTKTGKVEAWLPAGTWVDSFTGVVYDGDRSVWMSRTLDTMPVLLKPGAIVPLDIEHVPENGASNPKGFEVVVVVGADGDFTIVEESETERGAWVKTPVKFCQEKGIISYGPARGGDGKKRPLKVVLMGYSPSQTSVYVNNVRTDLEIFGNVPFLDVGVVDSASCTTIRLGPRPQLAVNVPEELIFPLIYDAEIEYKLKDKIDEIITNKQSSVATKASQIGALDMDADLRDLILEYLLADSRST